MPANHERQQSRIIATLRKILRGNGLSIREIGLRLNVSPATVKRWLGGKGLTVDRLEDLCALAGVTLAELAEIATEPPRELARELTLAQELALTENSLLSFLFFMIMSGWPPRDLHDEFGVPMERLDSFLQRLERLALIDRLPDGRARSRIDRRVAWRRGPMRSHFQKHMREQILKIDFSDPDTIYSAETAKLSHLGLARLEELFEQFRLDVQKLADDDRRHSLLPREWYSVLVSAWPMDMKPLRELGAPALADSANVRD
ncbi:hypothetical protein MB02_01635 [Croceicoccus estronivorus]|uniref:helix-turn-helix domain-containing protein n=1 Tax=Croceicoccus estronivorus TaxID=1172626 RepID=UPI00082C416F|nr:helix-turn-helix transcriptional regulator [Croceicoccus estronivorus]OCC25387.1 hypothetical protein MB02_01635 [Croceicoccus estronivorus]